MDQRSATRSADARLAAFAGKRHGVFTNLQAADLGLSATMLRRRIAAKRLWRLHVGVYSIVPPRLLRKEGR